MSALAVVLLALGVAPAHAASVAKKAVAPVVATAPPIDYRNAYRNYLVGRFAMTQGDVATASLRMGAAVSYDPANADLRQKAFLISILNGDIDQAADLGAGSASTPTSQLMVHMIGAVRAIHEGRPAAAEHELDTVLKTDINERSSRMIKPYVLAMNGQWDKALAEPDTSAAGTSDRDRLMGFLIKLDHARLNEIKGHPDAAEVQYKALYQPGAAAVIFGPDYANFLERQGRRDEAAAIWTAISQQASDPSSQQALERIKAKAPPPPLPDLRQSVAQALFLSATLYFSGNDTEMALANVRLSLYLDPAPERARIFLGQIEEELKNNDAADAAWAAVAPESPYYSEATLRRIWGLRAQDRLPEALNLVDQVLARQPDALSFTIEKADILHAQDKDAEALAVLNARIKRAGDADFTWQARFLQAMVYDSLDQWPNAETAIKQAQGLAPDRPEVMNFLGYGWINRGLHVQEGMDLVRRALQLQPKSGAVIDSLGWGYYKLGNYDEALGFIEEAVQLDPSDAEVNDHLGDIYKAMGRNVEANYEWSRVLTLKATSRELAGVRQKIDANAALIAAGAHKTQPQATAFNDAAAAKKP
jgi:tetratricopeptide (TPR) repeat protein